MNAVILRCVFYFQQLVKQLVAKQFYKLLSRIFQLLFSKTLNLLLFSFILLNLFCFPCSWLIRAFEMFKQKRNLQQFEMNNCPVLLSHWHADDKPELVNSRASKRILDHLIF